MQKISSYLPPVFEDLGFRYFGPIDGHNINELVDTLKNIKELRYSSGTTYYYNKRAKDWIMQKA